MPVTCALPWQEASAPRAVSPRRAPPAPPPLPPLYSAAGGGRSSEDGGWRSRPAPAHPHRPCPARSPARRGRPSCRRLPRFCPSLRRSPGLLPLALPLRAPLASPCPPSLLTLAPPRPSPLLPFRGGLAGSPSSGGRRCHSPSPPPVCRDTADKFSTSPPPTLRPLQIAPQLRARQRWLRATAQDQLRGRAAQGGHRAFCRWASPLRRGQRSPGCPGPAAPSGRRWRCRPPPAGRRCPPEGAAPGLGRPPPGRTGQDRP